MKIRPQITSVEERISRPAWRSASPKKRNTLSVKTSATTVAQKRTISPKEASQSRGSASPSLTHGYLMFTISGWVASSVCVKT